MNGPLRGSGERVLPSLLDRLITPEQHGVLTGVRPSGTAEENRGVSEIGVKEPAYRDHIFRDLEWLFNTSSSLGLMAPEELKRFPNVAASVVNYGLRGVFGRVISDLGAVEREVSAAVARFEPRLRVERQALRASREGQLVEIEIQGTLLTRRASRHLWVRTDLETMFSNIRLESHG